MASRQSLQVLQLSGQAPYGFRLVGGDSSPLVVSKIRPYSKADQSGLIEGDVVLAINSVSTQNLSHKTATDLTESDSQGVTLHLLRGNPSESDIDSAQTSLNGDIRTLTDCEAAQIINPSTSSKKIALGYSQVRQVSYDSDSEEKPFQLQMPPSGGLKQMRIFRENLEKTKAAENMATQSNYGYGNLDLRRDQRMTTSLGEPGFYSKHEETFDEGDGTRRVTEEVTRDKIGGTTVTRVVKQEVSNRQVPVNQRVQFNQPSFVVTSHDDYNDRGDESIADDWLYGNTTAPAQTVRVQTYNHNANTWEDGNKGPSRGQPTNAYDFPKMIQDLENCTTWDGQGGRGSSNSRAVPTNGWNNQQGTSVEMRPGAEIQIQFQPRSAYEQFGTQPKVEIQRFNQSQQSQQRQPDPYQPSVEVQHQYGGGTQQYSYGTPSQLDHYSFSGATVPTKPVIQVHSSNDDQPHVEFHVQPATRGPRIEEKPYMTEVYETTQTRRTITEDNGPVTVRSYGGPASNESSSGPRAPARWATSGGNSPGVRQDNMRQIDYDDASNSTSQQTWNPAQNSQPSWDSNVIVQNESGSLTRSVPSNQQQWNAKPQSWGRPQDSQSGNVARSQNIEDDYQGYQQPANSWQSSQNDSQYPSNLHEGGHSPRGNYPNASQGGPGSAALRNQTNPLQGYQPPNNQSGYNNSVQSPQSYQKQSLPSYQSQASMQGYQQPYQPPQQGYSSPQSHQQQAGPSFQGYQGGNMGPDPRNGRPQNTWQPANNNMYQDEQPMPNNQCGYYGNNEQQQYGQYDDNQGNSYESQQQYSQQWGAPPPPAPPAPPAPPMAPPPPPQANKNVYGPSAVPERVKVAKAVAHSVMSPENQNSRGQNMFLRRQADSQHWTAGKGGEDEGAGYGRGESSWSRSEVSPAPQPQFNQRAGNLNHVSSVSPQPRPPSAGLTADLAQGMGRGGQLFAKRKERADRWAAADDTGYNAPRPGPASSMTSSPQPQQGQAFRPMKMNIISRANSQPMGTPAASPYNQVASQPKYGYTDL